MRAEVVLEPTANCINIVTFEVFEIAVDSLDYI